MWDGLAVNSRVDEAPLWNSSPSVGNDEKLRLVRSQGEAQGGGVVGDPIATSLQGTLLFSGRAGVRREGDVISVN